MLSVYSEGITSIIILIELPHSSRICHLLMVMATCIIYFPYIPHLSILIFMSCCLLLLHCLSYIHIIYFLFLSLWRLNIKLSAVFFFMYLAKMKWKDVHEQSMELTNRWMKLFISILAASSSSSCLFFKIHHSFIPYNSLIEFILISSGSFFPIVK